MKKFDDKTSRAILAALKADSRISWQELGRTVHLSGQAAAERVRQMQEAGIISGFTLRQDRLPRHFIDIFMAHNRFDEFEALLAADPDVESAYKTSGDCCYRIVCTAPTAEQLDALLTRLTPHCRYRVSSCLKQVK